MIPEKLIRRDAPLHAGATVEVLISTSYKIEVDEWLDGDESITVAEIEKRMRTCFGQTYRRIDNALAEQRIPGEFVDDTWHMTLPSTVVCTCGGEHDHAADPDCPALYEGTIIDARFETPYEQERREGKYANYGETPVYVEPVRAVRS